MCLCYFAEILEMKLCSLLQHESQILKTPCNQICHLLFNFWLPQQKAPEGQHEEKHLQTLFVRSMSCVLMRPTLPLPPSRGDGCVCQCVHVCSVGHRAAASSSSRVVHLALVL